MTLAAEIEKKRAFGEAVCQKLKQTIDDLGFDKVELYPEYQTLQFELMKDPYSGETNLFGLWIDVHKQRIGQLQFQTGDSCYAEFDVVKPHPSKKKWFVEAVTAWGNQENLTAEAKLLAMPS